LISRGEIYDVDLGHPIGHEPAFTRPAIVVSAHVLNNGAGNLVVIVPVGSTSYSLRSHVEIEHGESGLDHRSYARCDQIRVISTERVVARSGPPMHPRSVKTPTRAAELALWDQQKVPTCPADLGR
jgi:mRNA interferase MazF